jgi:hypothetical protein
MKLPFFLLYSVLLDDLDLKPPIVLFALTLLLVKLVTLIYNSGRPILVGGVRHAIHAAVVTSLVPSREKSINCCTVYL